MASIKPTEEGKKKGIAEGFYNGLLWTVTGLKAAFTVAAIGGVAMAADQVFNGGDITRALLGGTALGDAAGGVGYTVRRAFEDTWYYAEPIYDGVVALVASPIANPWLQFLAGLAVPVALWNPIRQFNPAILGMAGDGPLSNTWRLAVHGTMLVSAGILAATVVGMLEREPLLPAPEPNDVPATQYEPVPAGPNP